MFGNGDRFRFRRASVLLQVEYLLLNMGEFNEIKQDEDEEKQEYVEIRRNKVGLIGTIMNFNPLQQIYISS